MLRKKPAQGAGKGDYAAMGTEGTVTPSASSNVSMAEQPLISASSDARIESHGSMSGMRTALKKPLPQDKAPLGSPLKQAPSVQQPPTPGTPKAQQWRLEDGDRPSRALQIVHELHTRYLKQTQRWRDYVKLFAFLGFVALFLCVLYLQRGAQTAHEVHSTVENSILPTSLQYGSSDDVLSWLQSTLQLVWTDPVCGDGVCEEPFEYPSYGHFGCRADCGRLTENYNVTTVQIDLYYDFTHPAGSVPATELLSQATWNLCPVDGVPSGNACYYSADQTFNQLTGSTSIQITDCPDGDWTLVMKRDLFQKVAGGVRRVDYLTLAAKIEKIKIALQVAEAQRRAENSTLTTAATLASTDMVDLVNTTIVTNYTAQFAAINTTYVTNGNVTNTTGYNQAVASTNTGFAYSELEFTWAIFNCPIAALNSTTTTMLNGPWSATDPWTGQIDNTTDICDRWGNVTAAVQASQLATVQTLILGRLDNATAVGSALLANLLSAVTSNYPELYAILISESGQDAVNDPYNCAVNTLATFYVDGYNPVPPVAKARLTRPVVIAVNSSNIGTLATLSLGRIAELGVEAGNVAQLPEVVIATRTDPGAYTYDYVTWEGGANEYSTCDLADREPRYVGSCTARTTCSTNTSADSTGAVILYTCEPEPAPNPGAASPYTSTSSQQACQDVCDMQKTCDALCVCQNATSTSTCAAGQVCSCPACQSLVPARADSNYLSIVAQQPISANASAGTGRHLLQSSPTAEPEPAPPPPASQQTLQQILNSVTALQSGQIVLQSDIASLQTDVDSANTAAAARAEDSSLQALINAGRAEIASGQAEVQTLLNTIIGKQNTAAASAELAAASLAAIQNLQTQQAQAQQDIANAVQDQITAIQSAYQQGLISPSQALELWKTARIDQASATKLALLSNEPCTSTSVVPYDFTVANYNYTIPNAARRRELGLSNRLVAGMLLQTTRTTPINCSDSRFNDIERPSLQPYGVDPVFKVGTTLYDPDLDNTQSMASFYNCSELSFNATYNTRDPDALTYQTTNPPPFCAELYNARNLPYGFRSFNLADLFGNGFPVWFDINMGADDAQMLFNYVQEGLYYDSNTRQSKAIFVTYNADLQIFSSSIITFTFTDGGSIIVDYTIDTLKVQLYNSLGDKVRLVLELLLFLAISVNLLAELKGWLDVTRHKLSPFTYFRNGWHVVDFVSVVLLFTAAILWLDFVIRMAIPFTIDIRYDVYQSLQAQAAFLKLNAQGMYLRQAQASYASLQTLVLRLSWYYAINGLNILLLIARILKLMDFQPRLGVVTRSLALAGPDLIHFVLVCGMVFIGYAMMAHLIFGNTIEKFATFGTAVNTCFAILLGDISVNDDLKMLTGLQGVAATLFFWSFELLVFMVLLNFLLAIIVDAFSEVKEHTHETTGLHTEVGQMVREQWRSLMASAFKGHGIPDARLGQLLDQWEGEDREAAEALAREAKSTVQVKRLKVLGEELEADELREVLQACLHDMAPQAEPAQQQRKWWQPWGGKRGGQHHGVNAAELDKAAEYVVTRFGAYSDDEEDKEAEDDDWEGGKKKEKSAGGISDAQLERERNQLAKALERLADVQHELADGQRNLMNGQRQLAEQQHRLVSLINPARSSPGQHQQQQGSAAQGSLTAAGSIQPQGQGEQSPREGWAEGKQL